MDYHEILGVPLDADQKTIKRAYFKLVRQYSPEKDPEQFQKIREAYENLTAEGTDRKGFLKLEFPADPMGDLIRQQLMSLMDNRNYKEAMKIAQNGLDHYGEIEGFLYYLAVCQMCMGNTGKAVKNFERLAALFPEKEAYAERLAMAYYERGYGKKAYAAFEKAYEMGCRNYDFLNLYAMCCKDRGKWAPCIALLKEIGTILEKSTGDNTIELIDIYGGILLLESQRDEARFRESAEKFADILERKRPYIEDYEEDICQILMTLVSRAIKPSAIAVIEKLIQKAEEIVFSGRKDIGQGEDWTFLKNELCGQRIEGDERLSEVMKEAYEAFVFGHEDPSIARFMQRDSQLCILEEWPGIKAEIDIVRKEYPAFWEALRDFVHTLEHTSDIERLRQQYQKDYDRREKYISGGHYYKLYPQRRIMKETVQWSGEDGTYTRAQPKIGRNDPCPCGSGKKYKNCCGRK